MGGGDLGGWTRGTGDEESSAIRRDHIRMEVSAKVVDIDITFDDRFQSYVVEFNTANGRVSEHYLQYELYLPLHDSRNPSSTCLPAFFFSAGVLSHLLPFFPTVVD